MISSWQARAAFLACLLPVVACQAPAASTDGPSPSGAAGSFVIGDEPVIDPREFGADYLLPGAMVVHEDVQHLFSVAFAADPTKVPHVLHLMSDDGRTWTGNASASVLADLEIELDEVGPVPSSAFVADDGTWVMYGGGRLPGGADPVVWRATAPGPDGPWTADPDPVLEPASEGWDSAITDHPSVVPTEVGFLMAYGGASRATPNRNRIGFATSTDGLTWARTPATLDGADDAEALGPGACDVDARSMVEPHLLQTDEGHLLVFGVMLEGEPDAMEILAATSSDGTQWTCATADPIASDDFTGAPSLHSFAAVRDRGATLLLVEVLGEDSSALWLVRIGT